MFTAFKERTTPETGRRVIQLTNGTDTCYPLYYFIPSFSKEENRIVYHRAGDGQVQLHCLDLENGKSVQLTNASSPGTHWHPWCVDSGRGVLDHRSVLDVARGEVIYFDDREARSVKLDGSGDRLLFTLPQDRLAIGQNCISPDGEWLVYIHHDRESYPRLYPKGHFSHEHRGLSKGTALRAYNLSSGEHRDILFINSPIHHVLPYGDKHLVFCHPTNEDGMLLTDMNGGWYTHLRTMDGMHGMVCHYVATKRGLAYEVLWRKDGVYSGLYDPFSHKRYEFKLPESFGYTHTGRDPEGLLWFYENASANSHELQFLVNHNPGGADEWLNLTGNWPTYGGGQKSHFHPQVTPDRKWILMTGGDPETRTNHLFLLDISDLEPTTGIQ